MKGLRLFGHTVPAVFLAMVDGLPGAGGGGGGPRGHEAPASVQSGTLLIHLSR